MTGLARGHAALCPPYPLVVRDDADIERHVDYIHTNPLKHGLASKLVDWPYSSFQRYVADGLLPNDRADPVREEYEFGE
ncbi:MAG: hypothetical protein WBP86_04045 [Thiobacillaceae bacterium]